MATCLSARSLALARTWTSAGGGFSVEAEFVRVDGGNVVLRRASDGQQLRVPLDKLSDADREFVRQQSTAVEKAPDRPSSEPKGRQPIPDAEALEAAGQLVREIYAKDVADAQTNEKRVKLAGRLLTQADQSRSRPADYYVLLRAAATLAAQGADAEFAFDIADQMAEHFDTSAMPQKLSLLADCERAAQDNREREEVAKAALAAANKILQAGDPEELEAAEQFADRARLLAGRARNRELTKEASTKRSEIRELQREFVAVQESFKTLKTSPDDGEANLAAGRYYCLLRGNWERGLPHLVRASDAPLAAAAKADMAMPTEPPARVDVGDLWWDLAGKEDGQIKQRLQARAAHWYRQALDQVSGLTRTKVEKRLAELPEESDPAQPSQTAGGQVDYTRGKAGTRLAGPGGTVIACAFSPDGNYVAVSHMGSIPGVKIVKVATVLIWDVRRRPRVIAALKSFSDYVDTVAFSADSKLLATGTRDNSIGLWSVPGGKPVGRLGGHARGIVDLAFSPDGKVLGSSSYDDTIRLWDVERKTQIASLAGHGMYVNNLSFSSDGNTLASTGGDSPLHLWDVAKHGVRTTLSGDRGFSCVTYSSDGELLAAGCQDASIRVWNAASLQPRIQIDTRARAIRRLVISPDKRVIAAISTVDQFLRLWDLASGEEIANLGPQKFPADLAISPNGRIIACGGHDQYVTLWEFPLKNSK